MESITQVSWKAPSTEIANSMFRLTAEQMIRRWKAWQCLKAYEQLERKLSAMDELIDYNQNQKFAVLDSHLDSESTEDGNSEKEREQDERLEFIEDAYIRDETLSEFFFRSDLSEQERQLLLEDDNGMLQMIQCRICQDIVAEN